MALIVNYVVYEFRCFAQFEKGRGGLLYEAGISSADSMKKSELFLIMLSSNPSLFHEKPLFLSPSFA
ncbi:MAG: hypothetical protein ACI33P_13575 [Lysinibacillus sp.]